MRTDARRNREKLLKAATELFAENGPDASLELVAKRAGVGIGTLYRNFPTRNDLIEEAYRNEVDQLCDSAGELLAETSPELALGEWMGRFVEYATAKRGMIGALRTVMASKDQISSNAREQILAALRQLLDAGIAAGTIRADADPDDVLRAMNSIWSIDDGDLWPEQPKRILSLIVDGLRYGAGPAAA